MSSKKPKVDLVPLDAVQVEFLEQLASCPDQIESVLKESRISGRRLASWLGDAGFRSAFMVRCAHYEELQFPVFLAGVRKKALGAGKDAAKFAEIYMGIIRDRAEYLLQGAYPKGDEVPAEKALDQGSPGQEDETLAEYGDLEHADIEDLFQTAPVETDTVQPDAGAADAPGEAAAGRRGHSEAAEEVHAALDFD